MQDKQFSTTNGSNSEGANASADLFSSGRTDTVIADIQQAPASTSTSSSTPQESFLSNRGADAGAPALVAAGENQASATQLTSPPVVPSPKSYSLGFLSLKPLLIAGVFVLGLSLAGFLGYKQLSSQNQQNAISADPAAAYDIQKLDLQDLADTSSLGLATSQSLSVNGQLRTNNSLVLAPTTQPTAGSATAGQLYYDREGNVLAYYNGTQFVDVASADQFEALQTQLQAVTGSIPVVPTLPADIATLGATNTFQSLNTFSGGLATSSFTTGSLSVASSANLQGSLTVTGATSLGPTTASSLVLTSPLAVSSGGTGASSLNVNGVVLGNGTSSLTTANYTSASQCLMSPISGVGAPVFDTCPGGIGAGVTSLNGLAGNLTIANATGVGTTITLNDATTASKGIASFNAANFSVTGGVVNTIQNIGTSASPTFAGVTATTLTGNGAAVTNVNAVQLSGQAGSYYLNATNIGSGTLADARLSANVALLNAATTNFTGTLQHAGNAVCDASNNCGYLTGAAANGSYIQLQATTPGTAQTGNFNITGTGRAAALYQNGSQVCDMSGNCTGLGGELTGSGTSGTLAVFTGTGSSLGNSLLSQSGLTVTVGGTLAATALTGNGAGVTSVNASQLNGQAASYYLNATNISAGTLADARLSANVPLLNGATNNFTGTLQQGGNAVCNASNNCNYLTQLTANDIYLQLQATTPGTAQTGNFNISGTGRAATLYQNGSQVCDMSGNCTGLGGELTGSGTPGTLAIFTGTGASLGDSILSQAATTVTVAGTLSATALTGNGAGVTSVNAAQLNGQAASYYLNATNISTGTLADARLSINVTTQGNTFNGANQLVQLNVSGQLPAVSGALVTSLNGSNVASGTVADARLTANVALLNGAANFTGVLQHNGSTVCDISNNCGYLTGSAASGSYVELQSTTPGTAQTGNLNITGTVIAGTLYQGANQVCDTSGNCAGAGGGLIGSGTAGTIAKFTASGTLGNSILTENLTTVTVGGTLAATTLTGNGSGVTNVNASQLNGQAASYYLNATNVSAGTLADARLSANVALLGAVTANFTGTLQQAGNNVCDTSNNCGYLTGAAADGDYIQLQATTPGTAQTGNFNISGAGRATSLYQNGNQVCDTSGNCTGIGGEITGSGTPGTLAIFTGTGDTVGDSILTQSLSTVTVGGTLAATTLTGNGSGITNVNASQLNGQAASYYLNATNLSAGTLADARLSANVALLGAVTNNFTGALQQNGSAVCNASNNCNYLTQLTANDIYIQLQATTPGTAQTGNFNISGTGRAASLYQNGNQVCDTGGNCVGLGGGLTGSGTPGTLAKFTGTGTLGDSIMTESLTTVTVAGTLSATALTGNGAGVTSVNAAQLNGQAASYYLNATNISTGTLADARLSANVALLNAATSNFVGVLQQGGNNVCTTAGNCPSGVTTVGAIDSQTKSANGAVISGSNIYLQTADASNPGLVSTGTQTFAGDKTFTGNIAQTGTGTFSTGTGAVSLNGATTLNKNFTVQDAASAVLFTIDTTTRTATFGQGTSNSDTFTRLSDPSALPSSTANDVTLSPDGQYMMAFYTTAPYLSAYKRTGDTFSKLPDLADPPTGSVTVRTVDFSGDGQYVAVAINSPSPYLIIYKRSGDTFTRLADPGGTLGQARSAAFSPDSLYLCVTTSGSQFIRVYKRSGDTFTQISIPATPSSAQSCQFNSDSKYLSVTYSVSPYVSIYKRSGDTFTKLADPATLPAGAGQGTSWSPDSQYLAVTHSVTPFITIYKRSGDTFTKLADPATLPAGAAGVTFSPDGQYLTLSDTTVKVYKRSGDTFTLISTPSIYSGTPNGLDYSADGNYFAVSHSVSPFVTLYRTGNGQTADTTINGLLRSSGANFSYLNVSGSSFLQGNLVVDGSAALNNDVSILGALTVSTIQSAASTGLNITGNAASAWGTTSGTLTVTSASTLTLQTSTTGAVNIDSGTTGAINIGTGPSAKTLTIGNTTGATALILRSGTGNISLTGATTITGAATVTGNLIGNVGLYTGAGAGTIRISSAGALSNVSIPTASTVTVGSANAFGILYTNSSNVLQFANINGTYASTTKCLMSDGTTGLGFGTCPGGGGGGGWSLTGNAATTVGTNFIGTTDNQAVMIKSNSGAASPSYIQINSSSSDSIGAITIAGNGPAGSSGGGTNWFNVMQAGGATFFGISGSGTNARVQMYLQPGSNIGVQSRVCSTNAVGSAGLATMGVCTNTGTDLAESYNSTQQLEPGDIVSLDPNNYPNVLRSSGAQQDSLVGIVSTDPDYVMGEGKTPDGYPIALNGRVPTKVNAEGGPILPGDKITSSSVPGVGKKATGRGMIVGTALTGYSGTGQGVIEVFVHLDYYEPSQIDMLQANAANIGDLNVSGTSTLNNLVVTGNTTVHTISVKGHIITSSGQPVAQTSVAAGAGATVVIDGNDTAGTIKITTGATGLVVGDLAAFSFSEIYGKVPRIVMTGQDGVSVKASIYPSGKTLEGFMLQTSEVLLPNTTYTFDYFIVE